MKFGDLRGILHYVPQFRGRTFVVAVDGAIIDSELFRNVLMDIAVLHSLNIRVVFVHGAGFQVKRLAEQRKITLSNHDGVGVTDGVSLEVSIDAIGRLSQSILQDLTAMKMRAAIGNVLIAHPAGVINGEDCQHTGKVDRIDRRSLRIMLDDGMIPVVQPLGYDETGGTYRLNSDAVAVQLALEIDASKIIFLTTGKIEWRAGVPVKEAAVRSSEGQMSEIPLSKLKHAIKACSAGVPRVHILSGEEDESMLSELFSNEGCGTMIHADLYRQIRPMTSFDIGEVLGMMRMSIDDDELVMRTEEDFLENLSDYFVMEVDGNIVGSVAVHLYGGARAELACLYIKRDHENQGYGGNLVAFAKQNARERGADQLFLLTTQAAEYFSRKGGFALASLEDLPNERRHKYEMNGRNSRVFVADLNEIG